MRSFFGAFSTIPKLSIILCLIIITSRSLLRNSWCSEQHNFGRFSQSSFFIWRVNPPYSSLPAPDHHFCHPSPKRLHLIPPVTPHTWPHWNFVACFWSSRQSRSSWFTNEQNVKILIENKVMQFRPLDSAVSVNWTLESWIMKPTISEVSLNNISLLWAFPILHQLVSMYFEFCCINVIVIYKFFR